MTGDTSDLIVFLLVVAARFIIPLFIPKFPLPAILAALVLDAADQTIFQQYTTLEERGLLEGDQSYDKALDIYYLTIAYVSALRNWTNGFALEVARVLWYYRLVGVVLFELFHERWLLLVFPNTFEYFFIAYELIRTRWDPRRMARRQVILLAAAIWIFIKLPQEWWIHVAQNDFTDFMKETIFGVEATDSWGTALTNRLWVVALLLAAVVGLLALWRSQRSKLPPADWSFRISVDRPLSERLVAPGRDEVDRAGPRLARPRLEKVVLITLVAIIFGQLLQIGASNLQILAATALVVVANAVVSPLIVRGGAVTRRTIAIEFAVLTVVNVVIITTFAAIVGDGQINRAAGWFFAILLTLIVTLYDRYRHQRFERLAELDQLSTS